MTDIDYEKTFGFTPESIGHRYRAHHVIDKPDYDDEMAGAKEGYLCVRARDGASNPIDPDACKRPNFVGTVEDGFDRTYRYYYYRPLTDADGIDSAALIASQAARIRELEEQRDRAENLAVERTNELLVASGHVETLLAALEPLARKEVPRKPQGNAGMYVFIHDEIRRARELHSLLTPAGGTHETV